MGLWEDAQAQQQQREMSAQHANKQQAQREQNELGEFASAMSKLGICPTSFPALFGSDTGYYPIKGQTICGWAIARYITHDHNSRYNNLHWIVTPDARLIFQSQRPPKRKWLSNDRLVFEFEELPWDNSGFRHGAVGMREPFMSSVSLHEILRDALAHYMQNGNR